MRSKMNVKIVGDKSKEINYNDIKLMCNLPEGTMDNVIIIKSTKENLETEISKLDLDDCTLISIINLKDKDNEILSQYGYKSLNNLDNTEKYKSEFADDYYVYPNELGYKVLNKIKNIIERSDLNCVKLIQ